MSTSLKDLQKKEKQLTKQINSLTTVAEQKFKFNSTMPEIIGDMEFPPYFLSEAVYIAFGPGLYEMFTEEPLYSTRHRSKAEIATRKILGGAVVGTLSLTLFPLTALLETPIAVTTMGVVGIKSFVYTKHNNNIRKARAKLKDLQNKLDETVKQINQNKEKQEELQL